LRVRKGAWLIDPDAVSPPNALTIASLTCASLPELPCARSHLVILDATGDHATNVGVIEVVIMCGGRVFVQPKPVPARVVDVHICQSALVQGFAEILSGEIFKFPHHVRYYLRFAVHGESEVRSAMAEDALESRTM